MYNQLEITIIISVKNNNTQACAQRKSARKSYIMSTKKNVEFTQEELNNILKTLDNDVFVRLTTNNDLAVEIFDTALPATRCGLWQRGTTGKRYDLYIGNATRYYEVAKTLDNVVDYITDKNMSKNEVAFLKLSQKDVIELVNTIAKLYQSTKKEVKQKATKKATTTKKASKTA